jgi:hypothetical protein
VLHHHDGVRRGVDPVDARAVRLQRRRGVDAVGQRDARASVAVDRRLGQRARGVHVEDVASVFRDRLDEAAGGDRLQHVDRAARVEGDAHERVRAGAPRWSD